MTQRTIEFDAPRFNGPAYEAARDNARLGAQIQRVYDVMQDGAWRTLSAIASVTGDPEASVSAQLRHLRKVRFGSHTVNRQHVGSGLYEYQLIASGINP